MRLIQLKESTKPKNPDKKEKKNTEFWISN